MTVKELIEKLEYFDQEAEVMIHNGEGEVEVDELKDGGWIWKKVTLK